MFGNFKRKNLFIVLFLFLNFCLFSQIKILSPAEGVWSNPQMLVIENFTDGEIFYSVDGSDPELFGFAYETPVLLEKPGKTCLKISHVFKDGHKEYQEINYEVQNNRAKNASYFDFIQSFFDSGLINYSAGSILEIPQELKYSLEASEQEDVENFIQGTKLSLNASCVQTRFIPCTVYDELSKNYYRFIIRTLPQTAGVNTKREVPFSIENWETINFEDDSLIFKVDTEYWYMPLESRKIDRSKSHIIYWQPVDYKEDNPVEFFVLPPKPEFVQKNNKDGSITFSVSGDSSYMIGLLSAGGSSYTGSQNIKKSNVELFNEISIDAFAGEKIDGTAQIGIYSNSIYQGNFSSEFFIDKRPPAVPKITSSAKSFYSRNPARIEISCPKDCELYISFSNPYSLPTSEEMYTPQNPLFDEIKMGEFKKISKNSFSVNWNPRNSETVYYKVQAYTRRGDNVSKTVEYSLIIDQTSYYYNSSALTENAEGTLENPFTAFDQIYEALKDVRSATIHVSGNMIIAKEYLLNTNFIFIGEDNASITFKDSGCLKLKGSSFSFSNFHFQNEQNSSAKENSVLQLENAVLTLKDSTMGFNYLNNANVIDSFNSIINISSLTASVNSKAYCSFMSSVKSRIEIKNSSVSTSSNTCVVISANEGNLSCLNNSFIITGKSGRIAELFGVKGNLNNNSYKVSVESSANAQSIYKNDSCRITEEGNNLIVF